MASNLHDMKRRQFKLKLTILTKQILEVLLKSIDCDQNYRVNNTGSQLIVRESTQHPPSEKQKKAVDKLFGLLQQKDYLDFIESFVEVQVTRDTSIMTSSRTITSVSPRKLLFLLGVKEEKPAQINVDEKTWALIPKEIRGRWDRFNAPMQKHIINSIMAENPEERFSQMVTGRVFKDSGDELVAYAHGIPRIPVRLPNPSVASGVSEEIYDLRQILEIKERHPKDPFLRRNPTTGAYFKLDEVIPDAEALENKKDHTHEAEGRKITP
ncbi:hypothetical protein [Legionella sp.]|uniref:hypothetical protein n=1 Tax=Legionella sp. TaxID=459 RepID=UPI00321F7F76